MNQTLLAVLALALVSMLAFSSARSRMTQERATTVQQVEVFATDAALEVLTHIRSRPFDAATLAAPVADPSTLTPAPFAAGGTFDAATDVDDFHAMQPHAVAIGALEFLASASVRYVREDSLDVSSPVPTFAKEVTVRVWSTQLPDTLTLSQVVTYP